MGAVELIEIAEAAERIQRPSQWLRRYVLARERETGRVILVRVGRASKRPRYRVNMGMLKRHCPELFDDRDHIAEALREALNSVNRRIEDLKNAQDETNSNIEILAETIRQVKRQVDGLGRPPAASGSRRG